MPNCQMYSEISGMAARRRNYILALIPANINNAYDIQILSFCESVGKRNRESESENRKLYCENALMKSDLISGCSRRGGFWE